MLDTEFVKGKMVRHDTGEIIIEIKKSFMTVLKLDAKYCGESIESHLNVVYYIVLTKLL